MGTATTQHLCCHFRGRAVAGREAEREEASTFAVAEH